MQKKIYIGGLPWELDRIGLLNYFKVMLEGDGVEASYELPFISTPVEHPNATLKVVDAFVAMDRESGKSRGFGFITMEFGEEGGDALFTKIVEKMNGKVMIGIRGPRDLIVNEATPRDEDGGAPTDEEVF
jgi:RNA recognition motif-containing protein